MSDSSTASQLRHERNPNVTRKNGPVRSLSVAACSADRSFLHPWLSAHIEKLATPDFLDIINRSVFTYAVWESGYENLHFICDCPDSS